MTDLNLLVFGCAVTFIAVAGGYVYLRECYVRAEAKARRRQDQPARRDLQDVA